MLAITQSEYYGALLKNLVITTGVIGSSVIFLGIVVVVALYGRYLK